MKPIPTLPGKNNITPRKVRPGMNAPVARIMAGKSPKNHDPLSYAVKDPSLHFIEKNHKDWKGYTLIEGFPGMGLVGTISTKYLVENLNFQEMGRIHSDVFMPIIRIHEGVPIYPSRIYVNDAKKLVVLISEQIIPRPHIPRVARSIVEWIVQHKISRVISLAGIQSGNQNDLRVYGIAANEASKSLFNGLDVEVIREGITTGITALMLMDLKDTNVKAISMLGNVTFGADYKAASELIKRLNILLNLNLKIEPLLEQAKKAEKEIVSQLQQVKQTQEQEEALDSGADGPSYYA